MKKKYPQYEHIFDYVHLVKNLRNELLDINHKLYPQGNNTYIRLRTVLELWLQGAEATKQLRLEDMKPVDIMNLKCVLKLLEVLLLAPVKLLISINFRWLTGSKSVTLTMHH